MGDGVKPAFTGKREEGGIGAVGMTVFGDDKDKNIVNRVGTGDEIATRVLDIDMGDICNRHYRKPSTSTLLAPNDNDGDGSRVGASIAKPPGTAAVDAGHFNLV